MKIFLSHYHQEASDGEDIADHLKHERELREIFGRGISGHHQL